MAPGFLEKGTAHFAVVIDIDTTAQSQAGDTQFSVTHSDTAAEPMADGGAAPEGDATSASAESDAGGPPQELLDAIRAAEEGSGTDTTTSGTDTTSGDTTDAGPAEF